MGSDSNITFLFLHAHDYVVGTFLDISSTNVNFSCQNSTFENTIPSDSAMNGLFAFVYPNLEIVGSTFRNIACKYCLIAGVFGPTDNFIIRDSYFEDCRTNDFYFIAAQTTTNMEISGSTFIDVLGNQPNDIVTGAIAPQGVKSVYIKNCTFICRNGVTVDSRGVFIQTNSNITVENVVF